MAKLGEAVQFNYERFARQGDILLAAGVVIILFVMLVPISPIFIDLMLTLSISVSLVVLVTTMFMSSPLEFSIYPSLLLVTTMLRLSMNVASTRLILLHGDEGTSAAGHVIQAFGQFVVGGNYVVGCVIFLILFANQQDGHRLRYHPYRRSGRPLHLGRHARQADGHRGRPQRRPHRRKGSPQAPRDHPPGSRLLRRHGRCRKVRFRRRDRHHHHHGYQYRRRLLHRRHAKGHGLEDRRPNLHPADHR